MKKNTSKKPYKISFNYSGIRCKIEIFYHENHSHFNFNVLAEELLGDEDLETIGSYLEAEGFYEDAKEYYTKSENDNIFYKDQNNLKNKKK